jgi:hypothetical protein
VNIAAIGRRNGSDYCAALDDGTATARAIDGGGHRVADLHHDLGDGVALDLRNARVAWSSLLGATACLIAPGERGETPALPLARRRGLAGKAAARPLVISENGSW